MTLWQASSSEAEMENVGTIQIIYDGANKEEYGSVFWMFLAIQPFQDLPT